MTSQPERDTPPNPDSGFSLMEMLVGLVLLSLTAMLLTASLRSGRAALNAISRIHAATPVAATQGYLRQALAQARSMPRNNAVNGSDASFAGNAQSVVFTTSFAPQGQYEGLYRVEIALAAAAQRGTFDLNLVQVVWRPPNDTPLPPLVSRSSPLINGVTGASFAFYGDMDDNAGAVWRSNWAHPVKMPTLVALDVSFAANDPRRWDRLILPVYASESVAVTCPPRGRCR
jgi:general secretion pathway protein J